MKLGFYPRFAVDGIRKNKKVYLPYILSSALMVMMYYILAYLTRCEAVNQLPGGTVMPTTTMLGSYVILIFAVIFMLYTNSFIMRVRKKEFGLYNILGMDKKNLCLIVFWETLLSALFSAVIGLIFGLLFAKAAEMLIVRMMGGVVTLSLTVSVQSVLLTLVFFAAIYFILFLNAARQLLFSKAVTLLQSEKAGERPPKGNAILGILGFLILGAAYYIAITIQDPVAALTLFFVAVIMVIAATYLIMIVGSVFLCRLLKKNKRYYYKANHFVSVSSMAYRMKRNGAGLASICILATMVLVTVASTSCLYIGSEDALAGCYPHDVNLTVYSEAGVPVTEARADRLYEYAMALAADYGVEPRDICAFRSACVTVIMEGSEAKTAMYTTDYGENSLISNASARNIFFVPLSDYNTSTGSHEVLSDDEVIVCPLNGKCKLDSISFDNGRSYTVKKVVDNFDDNGHGASISFPCYMVFVNDFEKAIAGMETLQDSNGNYLLNFYWDLGYDTGMEKQQQIDTYTAFKADWADGKYEGVYDFSQNTSRIFLSSKEANRGDFYATYGGLFFIGIVLSIVFTLAAAMIIYYKQITEGYEDKSRFEIMQKVGMTRKGIRKSINSQLLTVFFLPLGMACLHLICAFPMIRKILLLFRLTNVKLFAVVSIVSVVCFGIVYAVVYKLTGNAYYEIVSDRELS